MARMGVTSGMHITTTEPTGTCTAIAIMISVCKSLALAVVRLDLDCCLALTLAPHCFWASSGTLGASSPMQQGIGVSSYNS